MEKTEILSKVTKYVMNNTINRNVIENKYLFLHVRESINEVVTRSNEIIRSANTVTNIIQKIRE